MEEEKIENAYVTLIKNGFFDLATHHQEMTPNARRNDIDGEILSDARKYRYLIPDYT